MLIDRGVDAVTENKYVKRISKRFAYTKKKKPTVEERVEPKPPAPPKEEPEFDEQKYANEVREKIIRGLLEKVDNIETEAKRRQSVRERLVESTNKFVKAVSGKINRR